jgi:hypothetical protein
LSDFSQSEAFALCSVAAGAADFAGVAAVALAWANEAMAKPDTRAATAIFLNIF